jgi:hypothetical protein
MPKSRRLVAVPFIGKDVPSHASEFAHPDVLIGLTGIHSRPIFHFGSGWAHILLIY